MRNKKFLKFLATAVLGIMTAMSSIGFAACGKDKGNDGDNIPGNSTDDGNGGNNGGNNSGNNGGNNTTSHNWAQEWDFDSENHWHNCTDDGCDATTTPEKHVIVDGECTVCDYAEHHFSQQWSGNETSHWHACEDDGCTEKKGEATHTFVDGECSVCHYVKDEEGDFRLTTYTINNQVTSNLQKVFKVGDAFNSTHLTVYNKESGEKLDASSYTVALKDGDDMQTVGKKTVEITSGALKSTYKIYVLDLSVSTTGDASVTVDPFNSVGVSGNEITVKSINDALMVYELLGVGSNVKKPINVADGNYYEKVYINVPGVKLIGKNAKKAGAGESGNNGAVIWFDNLAGEKDPSGNEIGTFSSYSVRVGAAALDFEARNVTFKNKYNTHELYAQSESYLQEKFGNKNTQAVALRVDSGNAEFYNCKMTGYHDTLHIEAGNHYYEGCWIEGHTDYIFGNNSNTYFYKCNIFSIGAGSATNGGYVVANRPSTTDYISVFNECEFDADSNTVDGTVALGRPWGANMKMAVIYSTISGKFSTKEHTSGNNNGDRYCTMSGVDPNPEYMMEYGNSGDGAISASLANTCTYISLQQAAEYKLDKIEDILGFVPGESGAKKMYDFTTFAYENSATNAGESGSELFDGDMVIKGTYRMNGNSVQITANTKIIMKVSGKVSITWFSGQGTDADASINYKNGCAEIVILKGVYIISVTVNTARPGEHTHVYGDWTVNPVPTLTSGGTAVRTCQDCELSTPDSRTVQLPALSADKYDYTATQDSAKMSYTYHSEYGDINFEAEALAGVHAHNYPSEWTVTAENKPTYEQAGKATKTCTDQNCNHDSTATIEAELPVLSSEKYVKTGDTATVNATGEATFTITLDNGDTVTFTAATPKKAGTESFSFKGLTENGSYTGTSSAPKIFFNEEVAIEGRMRVQAGTGIEVFANSTVIKLHDAGRVTITWYKNGAGGYGRDGNAEISYENGCAIITITSGGDANIYIEAITIDRNDIPQDTPQVSTTTFNFADYGQGDTPASFFNGNITVTGNYWLHGQAIKLSTNDSIAVNVQGSISVEWWGGSLGNAANGVITYKDGCATLKIVDADSGVYIKSITVNHNDIPTDTPLELACITNGFMLVASDDLTSSETVTINGVTVHNTKYLLFTNGASIKIKVKAGSKITLYGDQYCGSAVKFNTTEVAAAGDYTYSYTAATEETVTIISTGTTYILYLNVDCGAYSTGGVIAIGECPIKYEGGSGVFHGAYIDASSGKVVYSGTNGGYKYAQINPGAKISFKVTDGITKDNIRILDYQGNALTEGTNYDITVSQGEVNVTFTGSGSLYVRSIVIE